MDKDWDVFRISKEGLNSENSTLEFAKEDRAVLIKPQMGKQNTKPMAGRESVLDVKFSE